MDVSILDASIALIYKYNLLTLPKINILSETDEQKDNQGFQSM